MSALMSKPFSKYLACFLVGCLPVTREFERPFVMNDDCRLWRSHLQKRDTFSEVANLRANSVRGFFDDCSPRKISIPSIRFTRSEGDHAQPRDALNC